MELNSRPMERLSAAAQLLAGRRYVLDVLQQQEINLPWEHGLEAIARYTSDLLTLLGAGMLITTGDGQVETAAERARVIVGHGPELVICLRLGQHISAQMRGIRARAGGWGRRSGRRMAGLLLDCVGQWTSMPSRRVPLLPTGRKDVRTLARASGVDCVLLECGFATSPADCELLQREPFQLRCAAGLAESLLRHIGVPGSHRIVTALLEQYRDSLRPRVEPAVEVESLVAVPVDAEPLIDAELLTVVESVAEPEPVPVIEPEPMVVEQATAPPVAPPAPASEPAARPVVAAAAAPDSSAATQPDRKEPARPPTVWKPSMGIAWVGQGSVAPPQVQRQLSAMSAPVPPSGGPNMAGPMQTEDGEGPDPMVLHSDGQWYSPRALAMLKEHEAREKQAKDWAGDVMVESQIPDLAGWWSPQAPQAAPAMRSPADSPQPKPKRRKKSEAKDPA